MEAILKHVNHLCFFVIATRRLKRGLKMKSKCLHVVGFALKIFLIVNHNCLVISLKRLYLAV